MARATPIIVAFFFAATVISAVLLFTGGSATVEEAAGYWSVSRVTVSHAPAKVETTKHAE